MIMTTVLANLGAAMALSVLILLAGCEATGSMDMGPRGLDALMGEWTLDRLDGDDVSSLLAEGEPRPTLGFEEGGRITGFAGVNRFTGTIDPAVLARGDFTGGPLATTRMAGPAPLMELESRVLEALQVADRYRIEGRHLVLEDDTGTLLRYVR